jgi:hypothetical protein
MTTGLFTSETNDPGQWEWRPHDPLQVASTSIFNQFHYHEVLQ